jgi:hypothetical protein
VATGRLAKAFRNDILQQPHVSIRNPQSTIIHPLVLVASSAPFDTKMSKRMTFFTQDASYF